MSPRLLLLALLLGLGSLAALGCGQRKDESVVMLERENRALEEVIWQWKDAYDEKVQELEAAQRAYRSQRNLNEGEELPNPTMQPPARPRTNPAGASSPPRGRPADPLAIPLIEGPEELTPAGTEADGPALRTTKRNGVKPTAALIELEPAEGEDGENPEEGAVVPAGGEGPAGDVDAEVTHIVLNPRLTGGFDFDKTKAGDEGVMVVIEPRNADGRYVPLPGDISVVVLDPAAEGQAQRVARWDYDTLEASKHLRKSLFGKGIHLELRWPDQAPQHEILRLAVRYTTPDKRKLEVRRDFSIVLPIEAQGRWTPVGGSPNLEPAESRPEHATALLPADAPRSEPTPAEAAPMDAFAPAEPGLLELPKPAPGKWKAVE